MSASGVSVAHAGSGGTDHVWSGVPLNLCGGQALLCCPRPACRPWHLGPWTCWLAGIPPADSGQVPRSWPASLRFPVVRCCCWPSPVSLACAIARRMDAGARELPAA